MVYSGVESSGIIVMETSAGSIKKSIMKLLLERN